jgi:hypothetical protein
VVAYLGLDPRVYQSGSAPARSGRISKQGSPQARWALVEAAQSVAQQPGPLHAFSGVPQLVGARKAEIARKHWGFGHCAACAPCVYRPLGGRRRSERAGGAGACSSGALGIGEKPPAYRVFRY